MNGFKLGDKVKRTEGGNRGFNCGETGTIIEIEGKGIFSKITVKVDKTNIISKYNDANYLELVEEKEEKVKGILNKYSKEE